MEAKIEDHKADVKLTGDEAITKLSPLLQELKFDKDTPDQEVIDQVVNVFKLDKDYQKFDLEVVFSDGTKKEYKRNKIKVGVVRRKITLHRQGYFSFC